MLTNQQTRSLTKLLTYCGNFAKKDEDDLLQGLREAWCFGDRKSSSTVASTTGTDNYKKIVIEIRQLLVHKAGMVTIIML